MFTDAEEEPDSQNEGLREVPDPEPELKEEEPFEPKKPVKKLSSSFTAYGPNPFEPRPET